MSEQNEVIDFEQVRKQQVAAAKPEIFCVVKCEYIDVNMECTIAACFFTEKEAEKAKEWMEKNSPLLKPVGWYEIEKTKLSAMAI